MKTNLFKKVCLKTELIAIKNAYLFHEKILAHAEIVLTQIAQSINFDEFYFLPIANQNFPRTQQISHGWWMYLERVQHCYEIAPFTNAIQQWILQWLYKLCKPKRKMKENNWAFLYQWANNTCMVWSFTESLFTCECHLTWTFFKH